MMEATEEVLIREGIRGWQRRRDEREKMKNERTNDQLSPFQEAMEDDLNSHDDSLDTLSVLESTLEDSNSSLNSRLDEL